MMTVRQIAQVIVFFQKTSPSSCRRLLNANVLFLVDYHLLFPGELDQNSLDRSQYLLHLGCQELQRLKYLEGWQQNSNQSNLLSYGGRVPHGRVLHGRGLHGRVLHDHVLSLFPYLLTEFLQH